MAERKFAIVVPTLNAARHWPAFHEALAGQTATPQQVLVVDSSSTDGTAALAEAAGYKVVSIGPNEFDHGGTRQMAVDLLPDASTVVFLTQDAILADSCAISNLLDAIASDANIGAAYGRQLPRPGATPIEAHARLFNYSAASQVRTLSDRDQLGFKTIFISNSFAAYRREALMQVGGFPEGVLFGEDTITAARLLLAGWRVAYAADAQVYHSHAYTWRQEFKRYFDIGVLHSKEAWLTQEFGGTGSEGRRFVASELRHLRSTRPALVPSALIRTALKLLGYRLGRREATLSPTWKSRLSMQPSYWSKERR